MSKVTLQINDSAISPVLYMALELSKAKWKVGFSNGQRNRLVTVAGGDIEALRAAIGQARAKLGLAQTARVRSCYEAGRDGFWLHRLLERAGVCNVVVDSASIEVSRQARRVKTDRVDVQMLLSKLIRYHQGEAVWKVVRVPDVQAEAGRHLHRELEQLKAERTRHTNRIKSALFSQGIRCERLRLKDWAEQVEAFRTFDGQALAGDLRGALHRTGERLSVLEHQIKALERERERRIEEAATTGGPLAIVGQLKQLKGIGSVAAWVFVMEFFGWRRFQNGKQIGALAGLTGTPYDSGQMSRDQGISKAGNRRVRALAIEIAWFWLRYQADSALSRWFVERFGGAGKRHRRVGVVALARKLLVALWRYLDSGQIPEGARLSSSGAGR